MENEVILDVRNVSHVYRQKGQPVEAITDINLQVSQKQIVAIRGESGSGKTTLLLACGAMLQPSSGEILINQENLFSISARQRNLLRASTIGYVFQTFNLLPAFTALENVLLGMTFARNRHDRVRAEQLLDRVGLRDRMQHKPSAMSVGEQQRVAVARALANSPRLLLADEPTANIDPANQQNIINLIRETASEEQISLLLVTHAMEVANQFDRIERLEEINCVGRDETPQPAVDQAGDAAS